MPDASFWNAVARLVVADDGGEDVEQAAADLLAADPSLPGQLDEAVAALDVDALADAVRLSDGLGVTEDAMIAVACAVIIDGPESLAEATADPGRMVRTWDLSRGDLLLALEPGLSLDLGPDEQLAPIGNPRTSLRELGRRLSGLLARGPRD